MILRARTILPVSHPPIENGAAQIIGNRLRAVGPWPDFKSEGGEEIHDLGEVVLLPGLVNAHCHLDYTDMAGELPPPRTFTDWIPLITAAKTAWGYSDYARSWLRGAHMLLRNGTTTVADIEAMPDLLPELWDATPLRIFSFLEMTGIRARREPGEILRETVEKIDSLAHARCSASLSPHAPYSTLPELLRSSARLARARRWPLCTHVAESEQEFEMFAHARGAMYDWLQRNHRDNTDCGLGSPVEHLARNKMLGKNLIAIHANLLARGDAALLGQTPGKRRPLPQQSRLLSPSPIPARAARHRRRQCVPRHRQPGHGSRGWKSKSPSWTCSGRCARSPPAIKPFHPSKSSRWPPSTAHGRWAGKGKSANFPPARSPI